ncbi:MAG TPA: hypothetical protein VFV45_05055 [Rubrobacteraceae bacterium]|nr:hypothetical protein [Rubrobacteraceae bacterium]
MPPKPYASDFYAPPDVLKERQKAWDTFRAATGARDDPQHRDRFFCGWDAAYNSRCAEDDQATLDLIRETLREFDESDEPRSYVTVVHTIRNCVLTHRPSRTPETHGPLCECDQCLHGGPTRHPDHFTVK